MAYSSESDFLYVEDLSSVPLTGADIFDGNEKLEAVETAERKLEADTNDGLVIGEPTALHSRAANAYASYLLFIGPEHPESVTSGQLYGGAGDDTMEFATELKNVYQQLRKAIEDSEADESRDSTDLIFNS
jgi:hypothetical protein